MSSYKTYCTDYMPFLRSAANLLLSPIPELSHEEGNWSLYWREKVRYTVTVAGFYMGILLLIPTFIWDVIYGYLPIAAFNTCIFILFAIVAFHKKISIRTKSIVFSLFFYLIGIVITVTLGSIGGGIVWMFAFPIAAGLLINLKATWHANLLNLLSMVIIGLGMYLDWFHGSYMQGYDLKTWVVNCINIAGLSGVTSITMGVLLKALDKSIEEQRLSHIRLQEEKKMMQFLKEKAENADRLKTSFLADVSHELRTPMNAILGFSDLLLKHDFPQEKTFQYIRIIHERGQTLMQLFNDIIDISRIETDQLEIKKDHINLGDLMMEIYELHELIRLQQCKHDIMFEYLKRDMVEQVTTNIDPFRLKQIMSNLLTNAFKFTAHGKIQFGFEQVEDSHMLYFVKDTGIGIPYESQSTIFDRYMQVDEKIKHKHRGFGLGLTICRSLVEKMGGKIWAESEPGKGSTFYFTLPFGEN
jgi:signal transduction histidine kinase